MINAIKSFGYIKKYYSRGPNAAREAISSGPRSYFNWSQRHFANN